MFEKKGNPINNIGGGKYINDSKIAKKNIYSKIAPPNTFKRRTVNKIAPKIIQRYEKSSQSNQISNPFINYNSNFSKRSSLILNNQNNLISNEDSNIKLSKNINSSFREKIKIMKGNLFSNDPTNIISPKKIVNEKMRVNLNNKIENNLVKMPNQYITKYKSVYSKKGKNQILQKYNDIINNNIEKMDKNDNNTKFKSNTNINEENNFIKDKYDYLLERTKKLLSDYQQIVEYYQEREKKYEYKNKDNL